MVASQRAAHGLPAKRRECVSRRGGGAGARVSRRWYALRSAERGRRRNGDEPAGGRRLGGSGDPGASADNMRYTPPVIRNRAGGTRCLGAPVSQCIDSPLRLWCYNPWCPISIVAAVGKHMSRMMSWRDTGGTDSCGGSCRLLGSNHGAPLAGRAWVCIPGYRSCALRLCPAKTENP